MDPMFIVAQKAMIRKGNEFLILKRSPDRPTYPNHWDFPGGMLEHGEDPEKGILREVSEESGLKVNVIKPIFCASRNVNDRHVFFVVYECELVSGEIQLSNEHTEFRWANREEILKLPVEYYLKAFLTYKYPK
jgi:8-oxo-dGTP diphosphatase